MAPPPCQIGLRCVPLRYHNDALSEKLLPLLTTARITQETDEEAAPINDSEVDEDHDGDSESEQHDEEDDDTTFDFI